MDFRGHSSAFESLNDDVLSLIIHISILTNHDKTVKNLSLTSRRLRSACLPALFEKAKVDCKFIGGSSPPSVSWPYIRTMEFSGFFTTHKRLDDADLREILPHLMALRKLRFVRIGFDLLLRDLIFLSAAPNIRTLELVEDANVQRKNIRSPDSVFLPFTEIIYTAPAPRVSDWRDPTHPKPVSRSCYMTPLILHLHLTLEILHIPAAMAPLQAMAAMEWPHMRELKLYGENYHGEDSTIFARLCARMPRLRVLDLRFAHKGPLVHTLIWPSKIPFTASFNYLDSVHLPYPDPSDAFYAHIPSTLRHLHLVDRPRYFRFNAPWMVHKEGYMLPTLVTSTELLHIFREMRGSFTSLEDLEVAFKADTQDRALVEHITSSFPNLTLFQVHRYRAEGETAADVESALNHIAQALSSLHYLRHFRMYLNLPDDDYRLKEIRPYGDIKTATKKKEFQELLHRYATLTAQCCGRALQIVDFLCSSVFHRRIWMRFYVERDDDDQLVVRFEEGSTYFRIYSDDTEGP